GIEGTPTYTSLIEHCAKRTLIVPPRMDRYIEKNLDIQHIFQDYASPDDILPYSIDEGFIDLTSSLSYFISDKSMSRKD
ncbi:DNA polymerase, partial [Streptococcus suis]